MAFIVHFGKYYSPENGGIESVTSSLAEGAVNCGHDVTVISFAKSCGVISDCINGVHVLRSPIFRTFSSQPLGLRYLINCFRLSRRADIVHVHYPNILAMFCVFFIPLRVKVLVHWHSDVLNKGLLGYALRPIELLLLFRSNAVVATSKMYAEASQPLNFFKNKIKVVPIGVKAHVSDAPKTCLPDDLASKVSGRPIILSVGRLVNYKGFNVLIDSLVQMEQNCVAVVVGDGPLFDDLVNIVNVKGLSDRILFLGKVSEEVLLLLYEHASIFCLPSLNRAEAFGVVLVEAMSFGIPIVASDIPGSGVPWVNQDGVTGFNFPVGDARALANFCDLILASKPLRSSLSKEAHYRFHNEFAEELSVTRINDIYIELLGD